MNEYDQALKLLERVILGIAPKHYPTDNAPNNYQDLMYWYNHVNNVDGIPVFNGGSEKTIYSSDKVNFAFRAWHDAIHIAFKLDFSYNDELKVSEHHVNELHDYCRNLWDYNHELTCMAAKLVYADVAGQVEYYYHHKEYVDNQKAFVYDYINNGFELPEGKY